MHFKWKLIYSVHIKTDYLVNKNKIIPKIYSFVSRFSEHLTSE